MNSKQEVSPHLTSSHIWYIQ